MPATETPIVTNKSGWTMLAPEAALTTFSGKGVFNVTSTIPGGAGKFAVELPETNGVCIKFVGFHSDTGNDEFEVQAWLFIPPDGETPTQWSATYLGLFQFKLGAVNFDFMGQEDIRFADVLIVKEGASLAPPGFKVFSNAAGAAAEINFDVAGADYLYLEIKELNANNGNAGLLIRPL